MDTDTFGFGEALAQLEIGNSVTRDGWNGRKMFLTLQVPDMHSKMKQPYIYITPVGGHEVPWVASQSDLLAKDWRIYPQEFSMPA